MISTSGNKSSSSCRATDPWSSLATSPYRSSPLASLQGYIPYPHIAAVCMFELVVLLLPGHMWGSIGVHHLWARPCFSSSVWFVWLGYFSWWKAGGRIQSNSFLRPVHYCYSSLVTLFQEFQSNLTLLICFDTINDINNLFERSHIVLSIAIEH